MFNPHPFDLHSRNICVHIVHLDHVCRGVWKYNSATRFFSGFFILILSEWDILDLIWFLLYDCQMSAS